MVLTVLEHQLHLDAIFLFGEGERGGAVLMGACTVL